MLKSSSLLLSVLLISLFAGCAIDKLAIQMKKHDITNQITKSEELARLRQSEPKFNQLSIREVGRLANADTVVWILPLEYYVPPNFEMAVKPAKFTVKLKVFNALAEQKEDIRLWPDQRQGKSLTIEITPHEIHACKTKTELYEKLATELADKIAGEYEGNLANNGE